MIFSQLLFYSLLLISIISSIAYTFLIISYEKGWDNLRPTKPVFRSFPKVSVIVACRNEEKNVEQLIENLLSQTYPKKKCEIIFIDDFSSDHTLEILHAHIDKIKVLSSPVPGKKGAIGYGIEKASGELILTTDADCIAPQKWIESHVSLYLEKDTFLQLGLVDFISENLFHKILTLEFYSLIGSAAGSAAIGKPVLSNAANMAFSKKIYIELKNSINTTSPSGDDVFLLQEIKKRYPNKIAFLKSKECTVKTKPPQTLINFIAQRIRWASKNKHYTDKDIISTGITVFSINLLLFINLLSFLFNIRYAIVYAVLFLTKSVVDFRFLLKVAAFFDKKNLLKYFPFVQLIYPIYVVIIGFLSFFIKYKWKDRKY